MDSNKTLPTPLNVTFKRPFYSSQGWEDIGNLTGQHSAPFQLYNDDGKTFLQVRQSYRLADIFAEMCHSAGVM